jgi:uncharacterized protein YkwD
MKARLVLSIALCLAVLVVISIKSSQSTYSQTKKNTPTLSPDEQALLNEINQARAHPQLYASYLEKLKPMFNGKTYKPDAQAAFDTQEGWSAVEDAIKFMKMARALGPLNASQGLSLAALSHVKDQSATGATGHRGNDSTFIEQRVKPYGTWQGGIGENLTYGNSSARERVLTWLIDDGFASRGHRNRLMSDNYRVAGISCGSHPEFGSMCVVTLAGGFTDTASSGGSGSNRPPSAKLAANMNSNSKPAATAANSNSGKPTPRKF